MKRRYWAPTRDDSFRGNVDGDGMPRAGILGYRAAMMAADEEFPGTPVLFNALRKSWSVDSGTAGVKAVPSSVLVPVSSGIRTKFPAASWVEGCVVMKSLSRTGTKG